MRVLVTVTTILALLAITGADSDCEQLMKPLDMKDLTPLMGKWRFLAGFVDLDLFGNMLNMLNSSVMTLTPTEQSETFLMHAGNMYKGRCEFATLNLTLRENSMHVNDSFFGEPFTIMFERLLSDPNSPDYLVSRATYTLAGFTIRALDVFGRSGVMSDTVLQAFQKQAECMGFYGPATFTYNGVAELCDEVQQKAKCEPLIKEQEVKDVTPYMGKWVFLMGYADNKMFIDILKTATSSWMLWTPSDQKDTFTISQGNMLNGTCQFSSTKANIYNIYGSSFVQSAMEHEGKVVTTKGFLLTSGPDILVMRLENEIAGQKIKAVYMFGRSGKGSTTDVEAYLNQAECLGFVRDAHFTYDGVTEFCEKS